MTVFLCLPLSPSSWARIHCVVYKHGMKDVDKTNFLLLHCLMVLLKNVTAESLTTPIVSTVTRQTQQYQFSCYFSSPCPQAGAKQQQQQGTCGDSEARRIVGQSSSDWCIWCWLVSTHIVYPGTIVYTSPLHRPMARMPKHLKQKRQESSYQCYSNEENQWSW